MKRAKQKTTTTTIFNPFGSGGGADGATAIKYPPASVIAKALISSNANASTAQALALKLGGTPVNVPGGITDSAGNITSGGADALTTEILTQGGPALFEAMFGGIKGFNPSDWLTGGTKTQSSYSKGFVEALNAIAKDLGGDTTKAPTLSENFGPGLTVSQQQSRDTLLEAINISGQNAMEVANATATSNQKNSAYQTLDAWLQSVDMNSLAPEVFKWAFTDNITNPKELMNMVRNTDQYKTQFAGLIQQQKEAAANGTKPLTEATYMTLVNSYQQTAQAAGLPAGFLTTPDPKTKMTPIAKLVAGNVSAAEFSRRVAYGYQAVESLPQDLQNQFMQQHGIGKGGLVAYFLDPVKAEPVIERQALGANLQYSAQQAGLKGFNAGQAGDLGEMVRIAGAGQSVMQDPYQTLTLGSAQKALQTASKDVELTGNAPGANAPTVNTATLVGAQVAGYEGTNLQAAQTTAERAAQAKAAPFEKGGGYSESAKGVTGIGSASI